MRSNEVQFKGYTDYADSRSLKVQLNWDDGASGLALSRERRKGRVLTLSSVFLN